MPYMCNLLPFPNMLHLCRHEHAVYALSDIMFLLQGLRRQQVKALLCLSPVSAHPQGAMGSATQ